MTREKVCFLTLQAAVFVIVIIIIYRDISGSKGIFSEVLNNRPSEEDFACCEKVNLKYAEKDAVSYPNKALQQTITNITQHCSKSLNPSKWNTLLSTTD